MSTLLRTPLYDVHRALVHDRGRWFLDLRFGDEDEASATEVLSHEIQSTGAGLVDEATLQVMEEIGWPWSGRGRGLGGPGIIFQGHDSLGVEVAASQAERAKDILLSAFQTKLTYQGMSMDFFGEAHSGLRWSALG